MSRDALKDAFIAGWNNGRPESTRLASLAFDEWYTNTLDTLNRATPDGWIEWDGSADMPPGLSRDERVDVRFRFDETTDEGMKARSWSWKHDGTAYDIIAYRRSRS